MVDVFTAVFDVPDFVKIPHGSPHDPNGSILFISLPCRANSQSPWLKDFFIAPDRGIAIVPPEFRPVNHVLPANHRVFRKNAGA